MRLYRNTISFSTEELDKIPSLLIVILNDKLFLFVTLKSRMRNMNYFEIPRALDNHSLPFGSNIS